MAACPGAGNPGPAASGRDASADTSTSVRWRSGHPGARTGGASRLPRLPASFTGSQGSRVSFPAASQTASASLISLSASPLSSGCVHTWPADSPVSAASGFAAVLKATFVH
jgi:hypothetical protein